MKLLFSVHLSPLQSCSSRFLVGFVDCSLFFISIMKLHYLTSKNWKPNFRRNFVFASIWAKSFLFLKTLSFYFLVNILKGELFWCLTFHPNSLVSESSRSWVITKMSSQLIRLWDYWKSNISLDPRKQRVLWNHCCLSVLHSFDWSVQHFSWE